MRGFFFKKKCYPGATISAKQLALCQEARPWAEKTIRYLPHLLDQRCQICEENLRAKQRHHLCYRSTKMKQKWTEWQQRMHIRPPCCLFHGVCDQVTSPTKQRLAGLLSLVGEYNLNRKCSGVKWLAFLKTNRPPEARLFRYESSVNSSSNKHWSHQKGFGGLKFSARIWPEMATNIDVRKWLSTDSRRHSVEPRSSVGQSSVHLVHLVRAAMAPLKRVLPHDAQVSGGHKSVWKLRVTKAIGHCVSAWSTPDCRLNVLLRF